MYIILSIYTAKFVPYVNVASALPIVIHYIQYIQVFDTPYHSSTNRSSYIKKKQRIFVQFLFFVAKKHLT